jgi:hypothetical protein
MQFFRVIDCFASYYHAKLSDNNHSAGIKQTFAIGGRSNFSDNGGRQFVRSRCSSSEYMASWNGELEYLATNVSILKYSVGVSVYWYEKSENGENSEGYRDEEGNEYYTQELE